MGIMIISIEHGQDINIRAIRNKILYLEEVFVGIWSMNILQGRSVVINRVPNDLKLILKLFLVGL